MTEPVKRVMLVTRNLPPLVGGMERLNLHVARELSRDWDVAVIGPSGCGAALGLPADRVIELPVRPLARFLMRATAKAVGLARRWRPAVVIAGSGLTAPCAWLAARASGARFAVYVHGLDLVTESLPYRLGWLPLIRRADLVIANSRNTGRLAVTRGIDGGRVAVVHPGTVLPAQDEQARTRFREANGLGNGPVLLSVGRLTARKGLVEFVENVMPLVARAMPGTRLLVIGGDAADAVKSAREGERERIRAAARQAGLDQAIVFMPHCDDASLGDAYQAADVHVFPVRTLPGDVEGFGMVAIEAAAHGLHTVAFDVGGVSDAVVAGTTGTLVAAGDYPGFASAVVQALQAGQATPARRASCRLAARVYGWDAFGERLRTTLSTLADPEPMGRRHDIA